MIQMFADKIDELRSFIINQTGQRCVPHWNWLCVKLCSLLSKYPSGITKTIILAEVQNSWANLNQLQGYNESFKKRKINLDSVIETRHIGHDSILEVRVEAIKSVPGTHTKLAVLKNAESGSSKYKGKNSIEMYLHQKLYGVENVILKNKLRFTGCRLWKGGNIQFPRLLPSENVIILLQGNEDDSFKKKFTSLKEIFHEGMQPHYGKNVRVEVTDIGEEEVVHLQNGETSIKRTVFVIDCNDIHAKFCLWDEQLPLANLFKEGDHLAIWQPFVVPDQSESYTLEYGPATLVYCLLQDTGHEFVLSQVSNSAPVSVAKDSHGMLDYSTYPERIYIADFRPDMVNVTILAKIVKVGPKENFEDDQHCGHHFCLKVNDNTGSFNISIFDHYESYHDSIYPGQCVAFERLYFSGGPGIGAELSLKTWSGGKIWNASCLSGWLATKYLVTNLVSLDEVADNENCICKAVITKVLGGDEDNRKYIKKVHFSCLEELEDCAGQFLHCRTCDVSPLNEFSATNNQSVKISPSYYWQWRYSLSLDLHDSNTCVRVRLTEQTAQQLFQVPVNQFASQPLIQRDKVLESVLAQEYYFGLSCVEDQYQVDSIHPSI